MIEDTGMTSFFKRTIQESSSSATAVVVMLEKLRGLVGGMGVNVSLPTMFYQHMLPSNIPFLIADHRAGSAVRNCVLGKPYSTSDSAVMQLRHADVVDVHLPTQPTELGLNHRFTVQDVRAVGVDWLSRLNVLRENYFEAVPGVIVVSDGAGVIREFDQMYRQLVPGDMQPIGYVEQTTEGVNLVRPYVEDLSGPVVNSAGSALKKMIEANIIARNLIDAATSLIDEAHESRIGVVGSSGAIGKSLISALHGHLKALSPQHVSPKIFAYNLLKRELEGVHWLNDLSDLLEECDMIFSATGADITRVLSSEEMYALVNSDKTRTMINLASGTEFESLLRFLQLLGPREASHSVEDLTFGSLHIKAGGMPYNLALAIRQPDDFDHPEDYVLTRGLMYAAKLQVALLIHHKQTNPGLYRLSPSLQYFILRNLYPLLAERHPVVIDQMDSLLDIGEIERQSQGLPLPGSLEDQILAAVEQHFMTEMKMVV